LRDSPGVFYQNNQIKEKIEMKKRAGLLGLILSVVFFAVACEEASISKIQNNPSKYYNKEVGFVGTVRDSYGVSILGQGGGIYKVDDGTGAIWVVSQNGGVPTRGARIGVKGRVQNGVNWNGRNYGLGVIETGRRVK
jgi:hypothetical protein